MRSLLAAIAVLLSTVPATAQVARTTPSAHAGGRAPVAAPATPVALPALPLTLPRVMVFGDSHAQYQQIASASAANRPSGLWETAWQADPRFNFDWWVSAATPLFSGVDGANQGLGGDHLDFTNNGGTSVTFLNGCLNRTTYAASRAPQIVWISCGTNSISSGDSNDGVPMSAAYVTAKLDTIVNQFTARGIWVILPTEYPRGDWPVGDARHRTVLDVNTWIRAQAARAGVKVMDAYALLTDPADATSTMPNAAYFQEGAAGIHLNQAGAWLVYSQVLKPVIESVIAPGSNLVTTDPSSALNLIPTTQALMAAGTAGSKGGSPLPTGTAPTGYILNTSRGTSTTVASIEDAATYKRLVLTITPVNDASSRPYHQLSLTYQPLKVALKSSIPSGSWVRYMVHIETPDARSASIIRSYLRVYDAGGVQAGGANWDTESSALFAVTTQGRGGYWLASKKFKLTGTATQADMQLEIYWPRALGSSFVVKIDRPILTIEADPRGVWNLP